MEVASGGERFTVEAEEIVLSSGAIASPQLLMLSGVGPRGELEKLGIPVIHELPGIGQNLRDHPNVRLALQVKDDFPMDPKLPRTQVALRYTAEGSDTRNDIQIMQSSFSSPIGGDPLESEGVRFTCILEFADGARGRVTLQGPGLGLLADGFLAEQVWGRLLVPTGAVLTDVSGEGFSTAIVDFQVPSTTATAGMVRQGFPIAFLVVVAAIIAAIKVLGWLVDKVSLAIEQSAPAVGGVALAIAAAVAVVAAALLLGGRRPRERTLSPTSPSRSAA